MLNIVHNQYLLEPSHSCKHAYSRYISNYEILEKSPCLRLCNTFQENLLRFRQWKVKGYTKKFTVRSFVSANAIGLNEREKKTEIIGIKLDDRIARVHPMTFSSRHVHTYLLATIARVHTCYKRFVTFSKATSRPGSPTFSHLVASILGVRLHMHGMQPLTDKHA